MTGPDGARRGPRRRPGARWPVGRRGRQVWLFVHVVVSLGWMGAGAANVVLAFVALTTADPGVRHVGYLLIERIDVFLVIPAAFAALVSGIVLGLVTPWGVLRHWWVLIKLVLTVAVIVGSTFGIGVWVETSIAATAQGGPSPSALALALAALANIAAFLIMTWLSVAKPFGTTPWAGPSGRSRSVRPARAR